MRLGLADVICDIVDSGKTLEANGLTQTLKLFDSAAVLVEGTGQRSEDNAAIADQLKTRLLLAPATTTSTAQERPTQGITGQSPAFSL